MLEQPHPCAVHELSDRKFIGSFSAKEHHKAPLGVIHKITKSEDLQCCLLMIKQGRPPPIERSNGSDPRDGSAELTSQMLKNFLGNDLYRIERARQSSS